MQGRLQRQCATFAFFFIFAFQTKRLLSILAVLCITIQPITTGTNINVVNMGPNGWRHAVVARCTCDCDATAQVVRVTSHECRLSVVCCICFWDPCRSTNDCRCRPRGVAFSAASGKLKIRNKMRLHKLYISFAVSSKCKISFLNPFGLSWDSGIQQILAHHDRRFAHAAGCTCTTIVSCLRSRKKIS